MKKLLVMTLLMMFSLVGNAQVAVIINDNSGGEVKVTKTEGQVVTITVTPSAGYYIAKGDIVVMPVKDPSATRSEGDAAPEEEKTMQEYEERRRKLNTGARVMALILVAAMVVFYVISAGLFLWN